VIIAERYTSLIPLGRVLGKKVWKGLDVFAKQWHNMPVE
jgi:hypothetical protein